METKNKNKTKKFSCKSYKIPNFNLVEKNKLTKYCKQLYVKLIFFSPKEGRLEEQLQQEQRKQTLKAY